MKFELTYDKKWIKIIESTKFELDQLNASFTKTIPSAPFNPLVKRGIWDGKIKFIQHSLFLPAGLYNEVLKWGVRFGIQTDIYGIESFRNFINKTEFYQYFEKFFENSSIKPYEYQLNCAYNILTHRMSTSELATSAGKTLIMFMTCVWLKEKMGCNRILMVVPKTLLVKQGIKDFQEYNDWNKHSYTIKTVAEGNKEPIGSVNFILGTYQSLIKREDDLFHQVDALIIDEAHGTKAKTIKTLVNKCENVKIKYGISGTLYKDGDLTDFEIQSYLGPLIQKISPSFLQDNGYATKIKIKSIILDYLSEGEKKNLYNLRKKSFQNYKDLIDNEDPTNDVSGIDIYNLERKIIVENPKRFKFVTETISKVTKNTLVLFSNVQDEYGHRIYERLKELCLNKEIFYIDGSTKETNREYIKTQMEKGTNKILVASFGTISTGISIKNIHNIFLIESYKSEQIIKQTIGRGMRLFKGKDFVYIVDFVDNFSYKRNKCITYKHYESRKKIYQTDNYPIQEFLVNL